MKKKYTKPMVMIESFLLNENMASVTSDCERIFSLQAQDLCGIPDKNGMGMNIFNTSISASDCLIEGGDDTRYDELCYHVPTEAYNLFAS